MSRTMPLTAAANTVTGSSISSYRPDIDGLRAVAVTAVVAYHAGVSAIPGGFVGVDVFFVISGYLVGGQIFREARIGQFRFAEFYARRVRRILPALYGMLLVMLTVGGVLLTPQELRQFAKESVAALLGLSNVLYYLGGGYFAPAADYNPLLMTWSLGVEEQFYLLFPFLALGLVRFRVPALQALLVLIVLSFAASLALLGHDPNATFYLLPMRAWELSVGAALALRELKGRQPLSEAGASLLQNAAAAVGLTLIVVSLVVYDKSYQFPGLFVLLPTFGTAVLIASPTSAFNVSLLSTSVATFLGRISYSWYLWHWPLFYLNRSIGGQSGGLSPFVLVLGSLTLGMSSWWFVEQRFRHSNVSPNRTLRSYAVVGLSLVGLSVTLYLTDGWPQRFSPQVQKFAEAARQSRENPCLAPYGTSDLERPSVCLPTTGRDRLVLFGDSHGSSLAPGIRDWAEKSGLGFGEMTKSSCHPFFGYAAEAEHRPWHWAECIAYQQAALAYIKGNPDIRTVVLAGFWASTDRGFRPTAAQPGANVPLRDALTSTIAELRALGVRVILVQDVPIFRFDPYARMLGQLIPVRSVISRLIGNGGLDDFVARADELWPSSASATLMGVANQEGITLLDPFRSLCTQEGCRYGTAQELYYFDFQHLTTSGAIAALRSYGPETISSP